MRITGGQARGIPLALPKGNRVRPATDALRQAVFSSIAGYVPRGAVSRPFRRQRSLRAEALSRGARGGTFVEKDARTAGFIRENLAAVCKSLGRAADGLSVVTADATTIMPGEAPDLVFVDPPYETIADVAPGIFSRLAGFLATKPELLEIFEMPGELELAPAGWKSAKRLGKGARQPTAVIFKPSPVSL
ncbi:MAG: RsmD family RNA methyltransferase [Lacunisphaera sp.]